MNNNKTKKLLIFNKLINIKLLNINLGN